MADELLTLLCLHSAGIAVYIRNNYLFLSFLTYLYCTTSKYEKRAFCTIKCSCPVFFFFSNGHYCTVLYYTAPSKQPASREGGTKEERKAQGHSLSLSRDHFSLSPPPPSVHAWWPYVRSRRIV